MKLPSLPSLPLSSGFATRPCNTTIAPGRGSRTGGAGGGGMASSAAPAKPASTSSKAPSSASSNAASKSPAWNMSPAGSPPAPKNVSPETLPRKRTRLAAGAATSPRAFPTEAKACSSSAFCFCIDSNLAKAARTSFTLQYLLPSGSMNSRISFFFLFTHSKRHPGGSTTGAASLLPMRSFSKSLPSLSVNGPSCSSSTSRSAMCSKISRSTASERMAASAGANSSVRSDN
mmetsp:Transcript_75484/g.217971  ORF Transcript_75484/g.217971 Transcript_75484/m.217971 type:complete len:231 (-) Transcript_75484:556-1248(-)